MFRCRDGPWKMQRKRTVTAVLAPTLALAGVMWNRSGSSTHTLHVSPSSATTCSAVALLSPPFYKCSSMKLLNSSGATIGRADWGYNREVLFLTLDANGDVTNYSVPATQTLTRGIATYPVCSAEWIIQTEAGNSLQVTIHLGEYSSGGGRSPQGCRPTWRDGTVTQ